MMILIGITGGIGTGKSIIAEILRKKNIPVYDTDTEAKRLMNLDPTVKGKLTSLLGRDIYLSNGSLDKPRMATKIFNDASLLTKVNEIVHPAVFLDFQRWATSANQSIIGVESAILFESGMHRLLSRTILVTAPIDVRIKRVMRRDHTDVAKIQSRINNQSSDKEKKALCDFIIVNDGKTPILPQINNILQQLSDDEAMDGKKEARKQQW